MYLKQESSPPGPLDFQFNLYFKFYLLPLAKIHHALTLKPIPWYPGNICKILSITRIPGNHNVKRVSHSSLALPDILYTHTYQLEIWKCFISLCIKLASCRIRRPKNPWKFESHENYYLYGIRIFVKHTITLASWIRALGFPPGDAYRSEIISIPQKFPRGCLYLLIDKCHPKERVWFT